MLVHSILFSKHNIKSPQVKDSADHIGLLSLETKALLYCYYTQIFSSLLSPVTEAEWEGDVSCLKDERKEKVRNALQKFSLPYREKIDPPYS